MAVHPDLEHYYDSATDRAAADAHLAECGRCRAWLEDIHERLRGLACIEFVELVTEYLENAIDTELRRQITTTFAFAKAAATTSTRCERRSRPSGGRLTSASRRTPSEPA